MSFVPVGGTHLLVKKTPSAESFTDLGCLTEIGLTRGSRPSSIVACISTPAKYKRPGISEPGTATFGIEFDPGNAEHVWLAGELGVAVTACTHSWQIAYPETDETDAATDTFDGFVSEFDITSQDVDGSITASLTIELVSLPVLADVV
jgi:hypothetical protein